MEIKIPKRVEVSAIVTRANGTVEDLGVISVYERDKDQKEALTKALNICNCSGSSCLFCIAIRELLKTL